MKQKISKKNNEKMRQKLLKLVAEQQEKEGSEEPRTRLVTISDKESPHITHTSNFDSEKKMVLEIEELKQKLKKK
jgi:1,2-phenylacetyl-CoA epoxidase catalytic subunit